MTVRIDPIPVLHVDRSAMFSNGCGNHIFFVSTEIGRNAADAVLRMELGETKNE
jgi:hypothetical protein